MKHNRWLLFFLGLIILGESISTGILPLAKGYLFTLLSQKAGPIWLALAGWFFAYLAVDFFQSIKGYTVLKVALWYRNLRTQALNCKLFGMIPILNNEKQELPTNTPQRIQEDIKLSYLCRITVWVEYIISGIILVQLLIVNIKEPVLVGFALVYAVISVIIAARFNPRLTRAEINIQEKEAAYRTSLVTKVTDITGLELANKACLSSKWIQTEYLLFTKLQLGLVAVLPYVVLLPKFLSGTIDLGAVVSHQATFSLIVVNAAILIMMYPQLIQGRASEARVKEVENIYENQTKS